jgi:hypothetical protein
LLFATNRRLQVNPIDFVALDHHTLFVEPVGDGRFESRRVAARDPFPGIGKTDH